MPRRLRPPLLALGVFAAVLLAAGCTPQAGAVETAAVTPGAPAVEATSEPPTATATVAPTPTAPAGTATPTPHREAGVLLADHYWLHRPIGLEYRNYVDRTYPYGSTGEGRLPPHTGVEFFNPAGTPVLAAEDATVYYAGTDETQVFGPHAGYYGNLIVLQFDMAYNEEPLYALYGHLSLVNVETGDRVVSGQRIGAVGGTGIASGGAHLHFEVRVGDPLNFPGSLRNPDLWIAPFIDYGTLAGRVTGPDGEPVPDVVIILQGADMPRYGVTYTDSEDIIPDDVFGENFTYGDLPEGWYEVSMNSGTKIYKQQVFVQAGRTTWIEVQFE